MTTLARFLLAAATVLFFGQAFRADDAPADQDQARKDAIKRGVAYLKSKQSQGGHWEDAFQNIGQGKGGVTALAALALLEAGEKPTDPAIAAALDYLKKLAPDGTYVASLRTLAFCKADPKAYAREIQGGADWLVNSAIRSAKGVAWGYGFPGMANLPAGVAADLSNTHFAVEALHAAAKAGAKVDPKLWRDIHAMATATQLGTGGWPYHPGTQLAAMAGGERLTMTAGGVSCLAAAIEQTKAEPKLDAAPMEKGVRRLGETVKLNVGGGNEQNYSFYRLMVVKKAAVLTDKKTFKQDDVEFDWRREGTRQLLKAQSANGSWKGANVDGLDVIATSFALRFLAD
jgi:hypothetical protein